MSKVSEFAAKQAAFNDRMDAAVAGIVGDVKELNLTIAKLQASEGTVSPEDQNSLDALEARGNAIAAQLEALDSEKNPVIPPNA